MYHGEVDRGRQMVIKSLVTRLVNINQSVPKMSTHENFVVLLFLGYARRPFVCTKVTFNDDVALRVEIFELYHFKLLA